MPEKILPATATTIRSRLRGRLTSVLTLLVLGAGLTIAFASSADAVQKTSQGNYDLRGFVSTGAPYFGCYTGAVSYGGLNVRGPSNLGVLHVYTTEYIQTTNSAGQWVRYSVPANQSSPNPGGLVLNPNQTKAVPAYHIATPAGYFWTQTRLDFVGSSGLVGTVYINPATSSDWNASYRYQGSGYSYCYHY